MFEEIKQIAGKWETFCNKRMNRGICDDRFSRNKLDFAENVQNGGNNSVEITRLARAETPHDFLVHWDLLRASFYGRPGWDSVLVLQQTLFEEHSNINHATVKAKLIVVKAVQGTCLKLTGVRCYCNTNYNIWTRTQRSRKCLLEVIRKLLKCSRCFYDEKNFKI